MTTVETWMPVSGKLREYPLELMAVEWAVYSKGHHDPAAFAAACTAQDVLGGVTPEQVRHDWWATRQGWGMTGPDGEYTYLSHTVDPWANGAYPVTVVLL